MPKCQREGNIFLNLYLRVDMVYGYICWVHFVYLQSKNNNKKQSPLKNEPIYFFLRNIKLHSEANWAHQN